MNKNRSKRNQPKESLSVDMLAQSLKWHGKTAGLSRSGADVTIAKIKQGYSVTLRNGYSTKIGKHLMLAITDDCVFFKADTRGYAVCFTKKESTSDSEKRNGYLKITNPDIDLSEFVGDYPMQYFEPLGLYYISKEIKYE